MFFDHLWLSPMCLQRVLSIHFKYFININMSECKVRIWYLYVRIVQINTL